MSRARSTSASSARTMDNFFASSVDLASAQAFTIGRPTIRYRLKTPKPTPMVVEPDRVTSSGPRARSRVSRAKRTERSYQVTDVLTGDKPLGIQQVLGRPAHPSLTQRVKGRKSRRWSGGPFVRASSPLRESWTPPGPVPVQGEVDELNPWKAHQVRPMADLLAHAKKIDSPWAGRIAAAQEQLKPVKVATPQRTTTPAPAATTRKEKLKAAIEEARQFEEEEALEFSPRKLFGCFIAAFAPPFVVENVAKPLGLCQ